MSSPKLIVVLGATGNQGSSVIESFLAQPQWKSLTSPAIPTAPMRDISRSARQISRISRSGPADKKATLDAAFAKAYAISVVSDFWGIVGGLGAANTTQPAGSDPLALQAAESEKQQLIRTLEAAAGVLSLERITLYDSSAPVGEPAQAA